MYDLNISIALKKAELPFLAFHINLRLSQLLKACDLLAIAERWSLSSRMLQQDTENNYKFPSITRITLNKVPILRCFSNRSDDATICFALLLRNNSAYFANCAYNFANFLFLLRNNNVVKGSFLPTNCSLWGGPQRIYKSHKSTMHIHTHKPNDGSILLALCIAS